MSNLQRILWQRLDTEVRRALGPDWVKKKLILFGAGGLGATFLRTFPQLKISYLVDSDPAREQTELQALPIHLPDRLKQEDPDEIVLFITSSWHEEIRLTLQSIGLVLNRHFFYGTQKAHGRIFFYLPQMDDFQKAFSWLENRGASYAVLRWFETIPDKALEDIHLLFETEDIELLFENPYLSSAPGGLQLEIYWTRPLGQEDELLTYPVWLADEILQSRTKGPGGVFVPDPSTYLKSLAYHVVFHKAENAKLPIHLGEDARVVENKYARQLSKLATQLDVPLSITLDGLWNYLDGVDWLPPIDLARRYASDLKSPWLCGQAASFNEFEENTLIFVFREWLAQRETTQEKVIHQIENWGLQLIRFVELNKLEKERAYNQIRGGNWIETEGSRIGGGPAAFAIFHDPKPKLPSEQDQLLRPFCTNRKLTYKTELKRQICDEFNAGVLVNFLHAADDLREGFEYIDCLDKDRRDAMRTAIKEASK